ncbi:substrate-binding periplasmic protein [Thalassotalea fusca]
MQSVVFIVLQCALFEVVANVSNGLTAGRQIHITVVTEDWPPLNYLNSDGEIAGNVTEKVVKILNHAGVDYDIQLLPWVRAYEMALAQPNVLIYTIYRTLERNNDFHWICPVAPSIQLHAFALASRKDLNIQTLEDLKAYKIGVSRNDYPVSFLTKHGFRENEHLDMSANNNINMKKLLSGRVDFVVGTWQEMRIRLKRYGQEKTRLNRFLQIDVGHDWPLCMALSKQTPLPIVQKLQQAHLAVVGSMY